MLLRCKLKYIFITFASVALLLASCAPTGIYHTVKPGQTLYRIAKTYDIEESELAHINHIDDPTKLKAGQRVFIPGASQTRSVPATAVAKSGRSSSSASKRPQKTTSTVKKTTSTSQRKKTTTTTAKKPPKATKGLFVWPLKGKILNEFGARSDTPHKGIEIASTSGAAIVASAPGKVIYSGNAIRGYGNLIILEHSDNYFTVYGYNKRNLVTIDDFVGQGDKIALVGSPPNGKSPRLHFEIRHGKSAVNPIFYLP